VTLPRATRRHAIVALAAVSGLVLGGLAWTTWSAVALDRARASESYNRSFDEIRALALARLDGVVAPLLYRESARPYNHFRRYYAPGPAINPKDGSVTNDHVVLESPLAATLKPDWIVLHFQATETDTESIWSSPQIEGDDRSALPAGAIAAADRAKVASAANWLAALREKYSPSYLMNDLELAVAARNESRRLLTLSGGIGTEAAHEPAFSAAIPPTMRFTSRSAAEFIRRGCRLLQMEIETNVELCVPETVALDNLESDARAVKKESRAAECVPIWLTSMTPLWLELTPDGQKQLAFVRSVVVEGNVYCILQGVLLDWERLRETLLAEVRDLFPDADVVPVATGQPVTAGMTHIMMQTIPARLDPGSPAVIEMPPLSAGLRTGLAVAWGASILALAAIWYGVMKYLHLAERRMRFVAAVTHELRTPLTSFQLYTDLLADMPDADAAQRRQYVETLRGESKRLARLVENVLAYSRIEDSRQALHRRVVRPADLLESVRLDVAELCAASGKNLVVEDACDGSLQIETDPELIGQILTNLVENACKYSTDAPDRRIWIRASKDEDEGITFEVDDAGPGIAANDRHEVFQPFRRGRSAETGRSVSMGLGLGLALSRYWAHHLGGSLSLRRSRRGGAGYSNFVLILPDQPSAPHA